MAWECVEHGAPYWPACDPCKAARVLNEHADAIAWKPVCCDAPYLPPSATDALARYAPPVPEPRPAPEMPEPLRRWLSEARPVTDRLDADRDCGSIPRTGDQVSADDFPTDR